MPYKEYSDMNTEISLLKSKFLAYLGIETVDNFFRRFIIDLHNSKPNLSENWKEFKFSWTKENLKKSDFPFIDGLIPVISQRAHSVLQPLINKNVEFLPINVAGERFYIVNVLTVYSKIVNLKDSYEYHYALYPTDKWDPIFKINEKITPLFVTADVKNAIEENHLTGCKFIKCRITERGFLSKLFGK